MRLLKKILILTIIFISGQVYCCEFDTSDYSYTFHIIEVFKGESKTRLIKGKSFDSCSRFPTDKSKWIIYADYREADYIDISNCLASRSEINPICLGCYTLSPPLGPDATQFERTESRKKFNELMDEAKNDWNTEIELLRKRGIK